VKKGITTKTIIPILLMEIIMDEVILEETQILLRRNSQVQGDQRIIIPIAVLALAEIMFLEVLLGVLLPPHVQHPLLVDHLAVEVQVEELEEDNNPTNIKVFINE
jgi:hypothetical protein